MSENQVVEIKDKKRKLPFGHFKVLFGKEEHVIKPLTQESIAEGWQINIPSFQAYQPVHHWSVTLAQLPPHLWCKLRVEYKDNKKYTPIIKDGIYFYSINATKHDKTLTSLYYELQKGYNADLNIIKELLDDINDEINGWLVIRAKTFLKNSKKDRYFADLL
jgi:hypothetical protein